MNDFKHALRQLAKSRGFTALAVVSLAVGIGINAAIFSVMDAAFLRPLPVREPDGLVKFERPWLTFPEYEQIRAELKSYEGLIASTRRGLMLTGAEQPERLAARAVSANYFTVLGIAPHAGAFFTERSGNLREPIVVISHALWQRRLGGNPGIVGQSITLNGRPTTVVAVAPQGFAGEDRLPATELWYPAIGRADDVTGSQRVFAMCGRLAAGVTPAQARAEAATVFGRPEWNSLGVNRFGERVLVWSEYESRMDHGGRLTYIMGPVVGLVLLVACANVSCLMLGRYEQRRREIAVRLALGASRWRLMRYLLAESALLAVAGAAGGLLLAAWAISAVPALLPATIASWAPEPHVDGRVLGLAVALGVVATVVAGFMPAWRASRLDVSAMLKAEGAVHLGKTPSRNVLVVLQVMIAMIFLGIAALFVRGFLTGVNRDFGFTERDVLTAQLAPERPIRRDTSAILDEIRLRVASVPGVRRVALANMLLAANAKMAARAPDDEAMGNATGQPLPYVSVDPGYFATLGIPMLNGRDFTTHDTRSSARVVIVNETLAKRFWPGENPVGKTLFAGRSELEPREVVGVARDVLNPAETAPRPQPSFYVPYRQDGSGGLTLLVAGVGDASRLAGPIREALRKTDASIYAFSFETLAGRLRLSLLPQWFGAWLGGVLGVLAFALAVSGLYGVVAYAVARRTRELGIRIALGAAPANALWLVLRQGVALSLVGVVLGLPLAVAVGVVMRSLLVGISPADPVALCLSALLVIVVAGAASYVPARRATRVNPVDALRAE